MANRMNREDYPLECDYNPLWYDCERGPYCDSCEWKPCRVCGSPASMCVCEIDDDYDEEED